MELSLLLLEKIVSMAIMMLMGFAVVKSGKVDGSQSAVLSAITLYVICPCMILSAFQLEYTTDRLFGLLIALIAAIGLHIVYILVTKLLGDKMKLDGVERASLIYSNGGNLIVPLVSSILGSEYVFYCCAFIAFQTILVWVHLPRLLNPDSKMNLKKIVTNPNMIAIAAGLLFFFLRVTFPPLIADTIGAVSDTIGPVAMLMIGMLMAQVDIRKTFGQARFWLVCFGRLIAYPLLIILLIWASRVTALVPGAKEVLVVTVLATSAPIAVSVTQMADLYGGDSRKASAMNVMSVIFCIITMPLMMMVYQLLC